VKETVVENAKLQFTLKGFSEVVGLRVFVFEGINADRQRGVFTVSADLGLTRRYGIRLQELPLLCRSVLDRCHDGGARREFAYTEEEMRLHAAAAREQSEKSRKPPRKPTSDQVGSAWRGMRRP
jgi:hypothetical protein